jgi:phosphatidylglycerol---prolipoprotein diacylglyceryl transferase
MQPEIHLGPLDLQTFGLAFACAFLASGALFAKRLQELGKPADWTYEAIFAALIGGLVGSRLDYIIQNWDQVSGDIVGNIFSGSGLVFFGGLIGGAVGVLLWARWRGFLGWELLDSAAAPIAIGYAVGRIGCQLSGDGDYGEPSDLPWAMSYPDGTVPTTEEVHPTPVYETFTMGLVTLLLWNLRDRLAPGVLFGLYLFLAGFERFLVEFIRRNEDVALGLTAAQLWSVGQFAIGAVWLIVAQRRGGLLRADAQAAGRSAPVPAT